jgi:hypothetical protein
VTALPGGRLLGNILKKKERVKPTFFLFLGGKLILPTYHVQKQEEGRFDPLLAA